MLNPVLGTENRVGKKTGKVGPAFVEPTFW